MGRSRAISSGDAFAKSWQLRRLAYYAALFVLFAAIAFYFGPNLMLFNKLTWITPEDFIPTAQRCIPVVKAMKAYERDQGRLPAKIEDLIPTYLPAELPGAFLRDRELQYWGKYNHFVTYRFPPGEEGWFVAGPYVRGRIPVAPVIAGPATFPASPTR